MKKFKHIILCLLIFILGASLSLGVIAIFQVEKLSIWWGILMLAVIGPIEIFAINRLNFEWLRYMKLDGESFPFFCLGVVAALTVFAK